MQIIRCTPSTRNEHVVRDAFLNRRNDSKLLRDSFPAGFSQRHKPSVHNDMISSTLQYPQKSFLSWTKGEVDSMDKSLDLSDPLVDVAGPYYSDLMKSKHKPHSGSDFNDPNGVCRIISHEARLYDPKRKKMVMISYMFQSITLFLEQINVSW